MKIDKYDNFDRILDNPFGLSVVGWGIVAAIIIGFVKAFFGDSEE